MQRRPLLAGNWKMHLSIAEAKELTEAIVKSSQDITDRDIMIAPPFTTLSTAAQIVAGSNIILAGQNVCWEEKGAFTGEISPLMLKESNCQMAIIGHSERRHIFGETDEMVNQRVKGCMNYDLAPILCIGEKLEEREEDKTFEVLENQLRKGLADVKLSSGEEVIIAYEPVWAIGTGKTASPEQAQEVHAFIRNLIENIYEKNIATKIRILYGGSVNAVNVDILMGQNDVDGALIGGAALDIDSFDKIIHFNL